MDLPQFLNYANVNAEPPRAPRLILWVPPGGRVVNCHSLETAQVAATNYAAMHPGRTVAIYELVGYAHVTPATGVPFIPAAQAEELLPPEPDTLGSVPPDDGDDAHDSMRDTIDRPDLTAEQRETLRRLRSSTRAE